jgi:hypothetical protein
MALQRSEAAMAPSIPTHRPLMTATRAAMLVAVFASASSVYLALGDKAQAAQGAEWITDAGACLSADTKHAAQ